MRISFDPLALACAWLDGNPFLCSISFSSGSSGGGRTKQRTKFNRNFLGQFFDTFPQPIYSDELGSGELKIENLDPDFSVKGVGNAKGQRIPVLDAEGNPITEVRQGTSGNAGLPSSFKRQQFTFGVPRFQGLEDLDFDRLEQSLYDRQLGLLEPDFEKARSRTREELSQSGLLDSGVAYGEGGALDVLEEDFGRQRRQAATESTIATTQLKQAELARKLGFDMDLLRTIEDIIADRARLALGAAGKTVNARESTGGGTSFDAGQAAGLALAGAKLFGFCWIALAIFGPSPEFVYARLWIGEGWKGRTADSTRWLYRKAGPRVADWIYKFPPLGKMLRPLFNIAVRKGGDLFTKEER